MGSERPGNPLFLEFPPPAAALMKRARCSIELGAIDGEGRITEDRPQAAPRCRCRRGWRAWWSTQAAKAPAKRPLRYRPPHRARPWRRRSRPAPPARPIPARPLRRAEEARGMVKRWAVLASPSPDTGAVKKERAGDEAHRLASSHSPIPTALPIRGGARGSFLLANGRGGTVDAASPLAREAFLAVAELTRAQRRAASCWRRRSRR